MNYLDFIPPELVIEILLYLDIDEIENLSKISLNVRDVFNAKLFWIKKLQFDNMSEYIPFLGRKGTYLEDYKEFMKIEEDIYSILGMTRNFNGWISIKLKKYVDIRDLIDKYTPKEIGNLVTLGSDNISLTYIEYRGKHKYQYESTFVGNVNRVIGELSEEEVKLLLIKLRLAGINLDSITNFEEIYEENEY